MFAVFKRKWSKRRKRSGDASKAKDKDSERSSDRSSERGGKRGRLSESGKSADKSNGGEVSSIKSLGGRDGSDGDQGKEKMDSVKESLERRLSELSKQLEDEKKNVRKEKLTVAKLQREVARNKSEGPIRESLMKDLNDERMLRTHAEQRVQEMTIETTACKSRLAALQDEFKKMEEMLRSMMQYKNKIDQLKQEKTNLSMAYEAAIQKYKSHISNLEKENLLLIKEIKSLETASKHSEEQEKNKVLLERLKRIEAENSSLVLENEQQRQQYERCLDDVANQVVQALLAQKSLREECAKLKKRVSDLECQNRALNLMFQQRLRVASESVLQVGKDKKNRCWNVNDYKANSHEGSSRSLPASIQHQQRATPGPSQPCSPPLWLQDHGSINTPRHTPPLGARDAKRVWNATNHHCEPPLSSSSPKQNRAKYCVYPLKNISPKSKQKRNDTYDSHGNLWGSKLRQLDLDYSNDEVCNYAVEMMETQDIPTKDQPPPIPPLPLRSQSQAKDSIEEHRKNSPVFSNYPLEIGLPNLSSSTVSLTDLLENELDAVETPNDDSFSVEYLPVLPSNENFSDAENDSSSMFRDAGQFEDVESPVYQSAGSELATSVVKNGEIHLCSEESLQRTPRPNSLNLKMSSNKEVNGKEELKSPPKIIQCGIEEVQHFQPEIKQENLVCERLQAEENLIRNRQSKLSHLFIKKDNECESNLNRHDADKLSFSSVETSFSQQDSGGSPCEHTAKDEGYSTMSSDAQSEIERLSKDSKEFIIQPAVDIHKNDMIIRDSSSEKSINLFTPQGHKTKIVQEILPVEKTILTDNDEETTTIHDAWSDSDSSIASAGSGRVKALRKLFEAKDRNICGQEEPARSRLKNINWIPDIELRIIEDTDVDQEYIPPKRGKSHLPPVYRRLRIPKSASDSNIFSKTNICCSHVRPRPASFAGFNLKSFNLEGYTSSIDIPLEKGVQFPLAIPLRRIPCQILTSTERLHSQQSSPNQRHCFVSQKHDQQLTNLEEDSRLVDDCNLHWMSIESSESEDEPSLNEEFENKTVVQGGARLKEWQPRTLMTGKNSLPLYVQLDASDSGDEFVLAFPSHSLGLCPQLEEQCSEDGNSEDSLAERESSPQLDCLPLADNTHYDEKKHSISKEIAENRDVQEAMTKVNSQYNGLHETKGIKKDSANLEDPKPGTSVKLILKARANLLDSMVPASSSGSESDPSEADRNINDVIVARLANRRRRREVFHYIPVGRISIANCREFFFRYGEREREAIACFDFLDEIPLSCLSKSAEILDSNTPKESVSDSTPVSAKVITFKDNLRVVDANDSLSLSDSCAESYTSSLPCINHI